nr:MULTISPECIES: hypothetical protein [Myxococcaceae]
MRVLHALVFLALAAPVLWGSAPEWRHLAHALSQPFHAGAPPSAALLAGALLAAAGALRLLGGLVRGRSAPLWASGAVLTALLLAWAAQGRGAGTGLERSEARANLAFLQVGRRVHLAMVGALQKDGEVARDEATWARALAGATAREDRVRDRLLRAQPPRVRVTAAADAVPEGLVPGEVLVWVSPDGATFELRLAGFAPDGGQPALLMDPETHGALVLKGLFNPDLPRASEPASVLPAVP